MFILASDTASSVDFTTLAPALSTFVNMGATLWFFYYTNTVTIPQQQKNHREERDQIRSEFLGRIKEMFSDWKSEREGLINEMKLHREAYERSRIDHKG